MTDAEIAAAAERGQRRLAQRIALVGAMVERHPTLNWSPECRALGALYRAQRAEAERQLAAMRRRNLWWYLAHGGNLPPS